MRRSQGFTLLEMSIVVLIISVLLAGGVMSFTVHLQQRQIDETETKMATIQKTLLDYWRTFKRIPCPANISAYNTQDANFGKEAQNPESCDGTPTANYVYNIDTADDTLCDYSDTNHDDCIYGGMVPVKTLRLPDDYAFDGWGRRIVYAVDSDFTAESAAVALSDITADVTDGVTRIIVKTEEDLDKSIMGAYLLLSHGINGHGAFPRYSSGARFIDASLDSMELKNCHCDSAGVDDTFDNIFYQDLTPTFDDIVFFSTRADLRAVNE